MDNLDTLFGNVVRHYTYQERQDMFGNIPVDTNGSDYGLTWRDQPGADERW